jgi:hypothetical protein
MQDHGVLSLLGVEGKSWETFSRFASCTFCITHFPDSKIPTSNALQGECQCTTVQLWKWQLEHAPEAAKIADADGLLPSHYGVMRNVLPMLNVLVQYPGAAGTDSKGMSPLHYTVLHV